MMIMTRHVVGASVKTAALMRPWPDALRIPVVGEMFCTDDFQAMIIAVNWHLDAESRDLNQGKPTVELVLQDV